MNLMFLLLVVIGALSLLGPLIAALILALQLRTRR